MKTTPLLRPIFVLLISILFLSASATKEPRSLKLQGELMETFIPIPSNPVQGSWTFMVYIVGSDLQTNFNAAINDIVEMWGQGSTGNINIIIATGGSKSEGWQTVNYHRVIQGNLETWKNVGQYSMADPNVLTDFVFESMSNFPAEHYALTLWNHGSGIGGYGHDEIHHQQFSLPQLSQTLHYINQQTNIKYDILGFDACLMATLEVASSMQGIAKYMVASEELEPAHGWDYTPIVQALNSGTITEGKQVGMVIADGFLNQALALQRNGATLSVIDLDVIGELLQAFENFLNTPTLTSNANFASIARNRSKSEAYGKSAKNPAASYDGIDLEDFVRLMKQSNPELSQEVNQLLYMLSQAVVYNRYDHTKPNASGLSIFFPYDKLADNNAVNTAMEQYEQLGFSPTYTNFLNRYVGRSVIDEEAPILNQEQVIQQDDIIQATCYSNDVDQVYTFLADATDIEDGDIEILGVMLPTELFYDQQGGLVMQHEWTGEWIGINGYPAYIAEIFVESYVDPGTGAEQVLYIITIPAVLNGEDIILTYSIDDNGYYKLENILPEVGEDGIFERRDIEIQPGDQLSLLYEGFNINTGEEYWSEGDLMTINSFEDIELTISPLDPGAYVLGFLVTDFAQNENIVIGEEPYFID
jgi:hypothetical protein